MVDSTIGVLITLKVVKDSAIESINAANNSHEGRDISEEAIRFLFRLLAYSKDNVEYMKVFTTVNAFSKAIIIAYENKVY